MFNGTIATMKRMASELNARGKYLTFSLKDHFSGEATGGGTSGGVICDPAADPNAMWASQGSHCWPYGEEVLFEGMGDAVWIPFREFNIPSRDFGKANASAQPDGCVHVERASRRAPPSAGKQQWGFRLVGVCVPRPPVCRWPSRHRGPCGRPRLHHLCPVCVCCLRVHARARELLGGNRYASVQSILHVSCSAAAKNQYA